MNLKLVTAVFIACLLGFLPGCGCSKKEEVPPPVPVVQKAELPELEQNTIYQTNQTQPRWVPDTSYREDASEQPPPPDEAEMKKSGPPAV